jgi:hypothetical protein
VNVSRSCYIYAATVSGVTSLLIYRRLGKEWLSCCERRTSQHKFDSKVYLSFSDRVKGDCGSLATKLLPDKQEESTYFSFFNESSYLPIFFFFFDCNSPVISVIAGSNAYVDRFFHIRRSISDQLFSNI